MKTEAEARASVGPSTYQYMQAMKHCLETKWEPRYKESSPMIRKLIRDTRKAVANFEKHYGEIVY